MIDDSQQSLDILHDEFYPSIPPAPLVEKNVEKMLEKKNQNFFPFPLKKEGQRLELQSKSSAPSFFPPQQISLHRQPDPVGNATF